MDTSVATSVSPARGTASTASLPPTPSQKASIYEHALWYHALGFNVVPLERPEKGRTKKPTCKWKGWQTQRQDRRDLAALHRRRTQGGEPHFAHGLLAIDGVNAIRHFDLDQVTSYEDAVEPLLAALGLPKDYPWVVQSGSGKGYHLCFRCTGDITTYFPSKAGEAPKAVYVGDPRGDRPAFDHVELRWQAALTTLPPSRHWTGGRYTFLNARPTELPPYIPIDTVIAAFRRLATLRRAESGVLPRMTVQPSTPAQASSEPVVLCRPEERWAQAALDKELFELAAAREGERNVQLNRSAFALGQIVAAGLLSEAEVVSRLTNIARRLGLDEREIAPTIQSGLVAGSAHPRTPPRPHGDPQHTQLEVGTCAPSEGKASTSSPASTESPRRAKPCIVVNGRQETEIIEEALAALVAANTVPYLFVRAGRITRIKRDEHGRAHMEPVTEAMLRLRLLECAEWVRLDARGNVRHAGPTPQVVQGILARDTWPFPPLVGVSAVPLVRPDGSLVLSAGYDPVTCMVYAPTPGLKLAPIPESPTRAEVEQALRHVFAVIGEFPYVSQADRANALGLLLTPLLRYAFSGHVPLALIDAPKQGTGKGLLTDVVAILSTGRPACPMQEPRDDDEWRKAITSLLLRGTSLIVIDNVDHTLHSGRLSSALTLDTWGDRLLCKNESVEIPFKCTWIANGNNMRLGGDLGSRSYRIRLDAKVSNPSARDHFTHKDLVGYVLAHRGELLSDLLTIVRFWYSSGCPEASMPRMRTFSAWVELLGSILAHAGVSEFLANLDKLRADADEQENQWYIFFKAWHDVIGEEDVSTRSLSARIAGSDPAALTRLAESLPDFLGEACAEKPATFDIRLGKALRRQVDTCFGAENLRLERGTNHHTGQPLWRVVCALEPVPPDPLQVFEQLLEPVHVRVAGDAGDQMTSQVEMCVQEDTTPTPTSGQHDVAQGTSSVQEYRLSTEECDDVTQSYQSPAPPASPAAVQSAEVQATSAAVVQTGAVSPEDQGGQRRHGEATVQRCRVQRCDGVPFDSGWCMVHENRAEILRVGALIDYPVLSYAPEHGTQQGEAAWIRLLQYPQCYRLAELLLGYLREQYPQHFPQEAARFF